MKTAYRIAAAVAGLALAGGITAGVAACGSSTAAPMPPTLSQAASQAGCRLIGQHGHSEDFAVAEQECMVPGVSGWVEIAVFRTNADRDKWEAVGKAFGGRVIRDGPGWAIGTLSK